MEMIMKMMNVVMSAHTYTAVTASCNLVVEKSVMTFLTTGVTVTVNASISLVV
jgi:hypothetical protein